VSGQYSAGAHTGKSWPNLKAASNRKEPSVNTTHARRRLGSAKRLAAPIVLAAGLVLVGLPATAYADPAVNLRVSDDIRAELAQAGAVLTGRAASEFTGLVPGKDLLRLRPEYRHLLGGSGSGGQSHVVSGRGESAGPEQLHALQKGGRGDMDSVCRRVWRHAGRTLPSADTGGGSQRLAMAHRQLLSACLNRTR
jgi:hypothetical protein